PPRYRERGLRANADRSRPRRRVPFDDPPDRRWRGQAPLPRGEPAQPADAGGLEDVSHRRGDPHVPAGQPIVDSGRLRPRTVSVERKAPVPPFLAAGDTGEADDGRGPRQVDALT